MAITFDKINRIIEVEAPDTTVTIQQLINAIRDWEDELGNFETDKVADASGKDDLGGGTLVGITLKLLNWKLKFEARGSPTTCYVGGGNLVAVDGSGNSMFPIEPSTNVTVQLTQSSSATMVQDEDIDAIRLKTDSLPGTPADESTLVTVKAKTDNLPADPAVQSILEQIIDEMKRYGGTFEPDKESLEAIRAKLDEMAEQIRVTTKRAAFKV